MFGGDFNLLPLYSLLNSAESGIADIKRAIQTEFAATL
jgi:hypothetical protein